MVEGHTTRSASKRGTPTLWLGVVAAAVIASLPLGCFSPIAGPTVPIDEELELYDDYLRANPDDIPAYLDKAKRHWSYRGDAEPVRRLAQLCVANNPGKSQAFLAAAMMLEMIGHSREAQGYARRYSELEPRDERGWILLAEIVAGADPEEALAILAEAIALFEQLLAQVPADVDRAIEETARGFAAPVDDEFAEADTDDEMTPPELEPPDEPVHELEGSIPVALRLRQALMRLIAQRTEQLILLRRYDKAYEQLLVAVEEPRIAVLPGVWQLHDRAARLEVRLERRDEAEVRLERVLAESASRAEAINSYAWLMFLDARAEDAAFALSRMLNRTERPEARLAIYLNLGYAEILAGRPERALPMASRALEVDRRSVSALLLKYQVLRVLDREAHYRSAAEQLARERVAPFRVPRRLATLQLMLSGVFAEHFYKHTQARDAFERAREMEPTLGWPLLALAQLEQDLGNYTAAIEFYVRAQDTEPSLKPDILCSIADCYFARGDLATAITHYEQALQAVPTHPRAQRGKRRATARLAAEARTAESN